MIRILSTPKLKNCIGLIALFFIHNFSSAQTIVYNVPYGNLINQGSTCGSGGYYNGCSGNYGFNWTSTGTVAPTSVSVQFGGAIRCDGTTGRNAVLNGNTGTQTFFNILNGGCFCNSAGYLNTVALNVTGYNPGGFNQMMITGFTSCEGFDDGIGGLPGGIFAQITVDYPTGLPVELASFNVHATGNNVLLDWETVSERDNDYFTVEKSIDGILWEPIIEVGGAGTSLEPNKYATQDVNPTEGIAYYRLKQTDYDGQFNYFLTKAVTFEKAASAIVFPNPFVGEITLANLIDLTFPLNIVVSDPVGKEILNQVVEDELNEVTLNLDADLAVGLYTVTISSNDEQFVYRVVKR
ncbi:MAG: hypothetical protein ACJASQ_002344 [Crocinitomicaceae bacterium]|jgi:hypothetical protein